MPDDAKDQTILNELAELQAKLNELQGNKKYLEDKQLYFKKGADGKPE